MLGPIEIGSGARIGSNAVVVRGVVVVAQWRGNPLVSEPRLDAAAPGRPALFAMVLQRMHEMVRQDQECLEQTD